MRIRTNLTLPTEVESWNEKKNLTHTKPKQSIAPWLGVMTCMAQMAVLAIFYQPEQHVVETLHYNRLFLALLTTTLTLQHVFCLIYIVHHQHEIALWILQQQFGDVHYAVADTCVSIVLSLVGWALLHVYYTSHWLNYTGLALFLGGYMIYYPVLLCYNQRFIKSVTTLLWIIVFGFCLFCLFYYKQYYHVGKEIEWIMVFLFSSTQTLVMTSQV